MLTLFSSTSDTSYLFDAISNQIVDYSGDALTSEGDFREDFVSDLAELEIDPREKAVLVPRLDEEHIRRELQDCWKSLNLCITEECNNRCRYCIYSGSYYYERMHRHRFMTWETARKAIDLYREHSARAESHWITFYGGEPLLNWDVITRAAEYVKENLPHTHIHISTNGILLDREKISFIIAHGISLNISIDGPRDIHDNWRVLADGRGTWDRVMEVLDMIRALNPRYFSSQVRLLCTVAPPYNLALIAEFFDRHPHLKDRLFMVGQVDPHDSTYFDGLSPEERRVMMEEKKLRAEELKQDYIRAGQQGRASTHFAAYLYENMLRAIHNRVMNPGPVSRLMGSCFPGEHQVYVSLDGKLYPCQRCGGCDFMQIGTLDEGLDVDAILAHIRDFLCLCEQICSSCWCSQLCTQCYVSGRKGGHYDDSRKEDACRATKEYITECMEIYTSILEVRPDGLDHLLADVQRPQVFDVENAHCAIQ